MRTSAAKPDGMTIIRTIPEAEATGDVAALYADDLETFGYVAPHTKAMAMNPAASTRSNSNASRAITPLLEGIEGMEGVEASDAAAPAARISA